MVFTLDEIKNIAIPITCEYGISKLGIFGSYSHGDEERDSDLDFYIGRRQMRSLLEYTSFVMKLEEEYDCHDDMVSTGIKDKEFLNTLLKESIL